MQQIETSKSEPKLGLRYHRRIAAYIILVMVNIVLFTYTSPLESSALVVIIGLLLISLDLIVVTHFCVRFLCLLIPRIKAYQRRLTVAFASFAIVATALASLGQLTWRDIVVVVIIGLIGYMYSLRFRLGMK